MIIIAGCYCNLMILAVGNQPFIEMATPLLGFSQIIALSLLGHFSQALSANESYISPL